MSVARGCEACRAARVKCDNNRPVCGRCMRLQLACAGYRDAGIFLIRDETSTAEQHVRRSKAVSRSLRNVNTVRSSRVQYVAPLQMTQPERLPWLQEAIPNSLQPNIEDRAVARFFANYVLFPISNIGDDGYLADLPYFYSRCKSGSALQLAVDSCSLASFSNAHRAQIHMNKARKTYGEALRALQAAISDPIQATRNETLMSLIVLDFFSLLQHDDIPTFLGPHSQGLAPILLARGGSWQLQSTVGWNLFRIAHRRVQTRKLFLREDPMPESFGWLQDLAPSHTEAGIALNALNIAQGCADARKTLSNCITLSDSLDYGIRDLKVAVSRLQELEEASDLLQNSIPLNWLPKFVAIPTTGEHLFQGTLSEISVYGDIWIATTWNYHRSYQLLLHETLVKCWTVLQNLSSGPLLDVDSNIENSKRTAIQLVDGILASIPFLTGEINLYGETGMNIPMKELGVFFAYVGLQTILDCPLSGTAQKDMAPKLIERMMRRWREG